MIHEVVWSSGSVRDVGRDGMLFMLAAVCRDSGCVDRMVLLIGLVILLQCWVMLLSRWRGRHFTCS